MKRILIALIVINLMVMSVSADTSDKAWLKESSDVTFGSDLSFNGFDIANDIILIQISDAIYLYNVDGTYMKTFLVQDSGSTNSHLDGSSIVVDSCRKNELAWFDMNGNFLKKQHYEESTSEEAPYGIVYWPGGSVRQSVDYGGFTYTLELSSVHADDRICRICRTDSHGTVVPLIVWADMFGTYIKSEHLNSNIEGLIYLLVFVLVGIDFYRLEKSRKTGQPYQSVFSRNLHSLQKRK